MKKPFISLFVIIFSKMASWFTGLIFAPAGRIDSRGNTNLKERYISKGQSSIFDGTLNDVRSEQVFPLVAQSYKEGVLVSAQKYNIHSNAGIIGEVWFSIGSKDLAFPSLGSGNNVFWY